MQQARGSFRKFVLDHELDVADASRFMAMISVTYADGLIACFDAKYLYTFWRPITAIRAGDTDGNDATVGDPDVVAAASGDAEPPGVPERSLVHHACRGIVIARFLQTQDIDFTIPSLGGGIADRHFDTADELEYDVANARDLGRHPLPLGRRGRSADRKEDGGVRARAQLPPVERLGAHRT